MFVTFLAVEKPGSKMRLKASTSVSTLLGWIEALLDRLGAHGVDVDTLAVVRDLDDDHVAFVGGLEENRALLALARGDALLGSLDAVVEGIAH